MDIITKGDQPHPNKAVRSSTCISCTTALCIGSHHRQPNLLARLLGRTSPVLLLFCRPEFLDILQFSDVSVDNSISSLGSCKVDVVSSFDIGSEPVYQSALRLSTAAPRYPSALGPYPTESFNWSVECLLPSRKSPSVLTVWICLLIMST
jgi:hypothetical protein